MFHVPPSHRDRDRDRDRDRTMTQPAAHGPNSVKRMLGEPCLSPRPSKTLPLRWPGVVVRQYRQA
jgi:hypothetical protein